MPKLGKKCLLLLLLFGCIAREARGLSEDDPLLLDRLLHVIWEPSGLVRLWVAFDQLYNVASSWRGVARSLITLPFKEARDETSHITIKGYNSAGSRLGGDSISAHRDRFAKAYSSSNPPEFSQTGHNPIVGGKGRPYLEASSSTRFPRVTLPNKYPSGIFHRNYFGGPSVFENSQKPLLSHAQNSPLLVKYLPGSSAVTKQLQGTSHFQKSAFDDLVKVNGNTGIFGDYFHQYTNLNRHTPGSVMVDAYPGGPLKAPGAPKVLEPFFNSLSSKSNAMRNLFASEHSINFPLLEENGEFPAFQKADALRKGTDIPSVNSIDRRHRNSKIRKLEGLLESSGNYLHQNEYHHDVKAPLSVMGALLEGTDPQVRLLMTLRLIKELGQIHLSRIQSLE